LKLASARALASFEFDIIRLYRNTAYPVITQCK